MRNSLLFFCLGCCLLLLSCQSSAADQTDKSDTTQGEVANTSTVEAMYESAADYAGKTEYRFFTEDGQAILISDGKFEEAGIKKPENMLEDDTDLEGPPGANPILIGKKFILTKDQDERVTEIALVEGQKVYESAIIAEYVSAAQYPMDMQYYFTPFYGGDDIIVYVSNDEETPSVKLPSNLLEDPNNLPEDETMLGPNPKVIGWLYVLSYEGGSLQEISAVPGQTYSEE